MMSQKWTNCQYKHMKNGLFFVLWPWSAELTENLWLAKTAYRWSWTTWTEDLVYIIYAFDVGNNNIQCFLTKRWMIINNLFCEFKWSSWHHISVITSTGCFVVFLWFEICFNILLILLICGAEKWLPSMLKNPHKLSMILKN